MKAESRFFTAFDRGARMLPWLTLVFLSLAAAACSQGDKPQPGISGVLRVAVLPTQNKQAMQERYAGLMVYLTEKLGLRIKLEVPDDYDRLLSGFTSHEIDLALFGGATFVMANRRSGAVPIVFRDVDSVFRSVILVRRDSSFTNLSDLKGKTFTFGSRLSTSGHFMPRYFLLGAGLEPERDFAEVRYSGAHDKTALAVQNGEVFAGAADSVVIGQMLEKGEVSAEKLRIAWSSPSYPDYVWALQPDFVERFAEPIRNAFLALSRAGTRGEEILKNMGAAYYLPANLQDWDMLKDIMQKQKMLD